MRPVFATAIKYVLPAAELKKTCNEKSNWCDDDKVYTELNGRVTEKKGDKCPLIKDRICRS
jgi:hypothetical protein